MGVLAHRSYRVAPQAPGITPRRRFRCTKCVPIFLTLTIPTPLAFPPHKRKCFYDDRHKRRRQGSYALAVRDRRASGKCHAPQGWVASLFTSFREEAFSEIHIQTFACLCVRSGARG